MLYTMYVEKDFMGDQVGTFPDLPDPRYFAHYPDEDIRNADEDEYIAQAWIPRVEPDSI